MVKVTEKVEKGKELSRTERLKERHFSLISNPELSIERARYATESYKETEGEPEIIRRAKAIKNVIAKISVNIWPDELIVGSYNGKEFGGAFYPDANIPTSGINGCI
ncbi:MAG: putative formate acetyltransferase 2 [Candidatus Methanolliviera sp. GoM_oil]|nr:MAG: putative formate acetyltransferase 2 [Candidatus Methanolliviera sp. GoM_oil]